MRSAGLVHAVLPLLAACGPGPAAPSDSDSDGVDTPVPEHWMAQVFDGHGDLALNRILVPSARNSTSYACDASHGLSPDSPAAELVLWGDQDTGTDNEIRQRIVDWARTQDRSIAQQLIDGIRGLELRFTLRDGELVTWHSVYGVPIDVILDDLVAFAIDHPAEIIVFTVELDAGDVDWPKLTEAVTAPRAGGTSMCDLVYHGTDNAALATVADLQASGRPLVWSAGAELAAHLADNGCPTSNLVIDMAWSITTTPEGVADRIEASLADRDPEHMLQNDFAFSLDGSANDTEQASYVLKYASLREANQDLGFDGSFPGDLIDRFDGGDDMNILMGDLYEDTNLIEAAIAENLARVGR